MELNSVDAKAFSKRIESVASTQALALSKKRYMILAAVSVASSRISSESLSSTVWTLSNLSSEIGGCCNMALLAKKATWIVLLNTDTPEIVRLVGPYVANRLKIVEKRTWRRPGA